jgi:hypothetical protein
MLPAVMTRFAGLDPDSSKSPIAMSGVMINGSLGSRIGQRLDSRNVFEWNSPKREFDRKSAGTDRDRVKKLTCGNRRISVKTMMDGSKCRDRRPRSNFLMKCGSKGIQKSGIEKSVDQNGVKK